MQVEQTTGATGLEPATSGVTGRRSNQLSYAPYGEIAVLQVECHLVRAQLLARDGVLAMEPTLEDVLNPAVSSSRGSGDGDSRKRVSVVL